MELVSGMYNPTPYPVISSIDATPELQGVYSYVIEPYNPGYTYTIARDDGNVVIKFADWSGNILAASDVSENMLSHAHNMIETLQVIRVFQAQFYVSDDGVLVDVKLSENKYLGPGMLRDIFSKISKVQGTVVIDKVSESLCARYPIC
jgi:hypothetical protein